MRAPCPTCGKATETDEHEPLAPHFPFCSERCRLLDLGRWFDEEYRVAGKAPAGPSGGEPEAEEGGA